MLQPDTGEGHHANNQSATYDKITTTHRAKLAYVYIRQSSFVQVRQHQESTDLQYRLSEYAEHLGWPQDCVQVIAILRTFFDRKGLTRKAKN